MKRLVVFLMTVMLIFCWGEMQNILTILMPALR